MYLCEYLLVECRIVNSHIKYEIVKRNDGNEEYNLRQALYIDTTSTNTKEHSVYIHITYYIISGCEYIITYAYILGI